MIMRRIVVAVFLIVTMAGAQDRRYMMVFLNTNPERPVLPKEQVGSLQADHRANMTRLSKEGKLLIAGPFHGGGGLFVLSTASVDSAWAWLNTDPAIRAERFRIELFEYSPRVGGICPVGEKYEMTEYRFVRYRLNAEASIAAAVEADKQHAAFLKTLVDSGVVIAEGVFQEGEGGILVGPFDESIVQKDPLIKNGAVRYTFRTLWIAKGSFCEE